MGNERDTMPMNEVRELLAGIMLDVQVLIRQQMAVLRQEIGEEVGHALKAASYIVVGSAIVLTSTLLLCLMVVHLLALMVPGLPLWACFGIVGIFLTFVGGGVSFAGVRMFNRGDAETEGPPMDLEEKYDA